MVIDIPHEIIDKVTSTKNWNWDCLEKWNHAFYRIQRVDYIYEPFINVVIDSIDSLRNALYAIEEEALMYIINELQKGQSIEIKDLIHETDLVVLSKYTASFLMNEFEKSPILCWCRLYEHEGDSYSDLDIALRLHSGSYRLGIEQKIPIVLKIEEIGEGVANLSAAIVHSDADKLNFSNIVVHVLKRDKKASMLDMLLAMQ